MDGSSTPRRIPLKMRRLHKPYMYKLVFEGGKALRGSPLTLRYFRADQDLSRVGFIIRKKAGDSPMRNSIRRTLRRAFQEALPTLAEGLWLIFDVSDKASTVTRAKLRGEADRLLQAANSAAVHLVAANVTRVKKAGAAPAPDGTATGSAS